MRTRGLLIILLFVAGTPLYAQEEPDLGTEEQRAAGQELYMQKCAQCHGETGDGAGYATPFLKPMPRDFTAGIFKFRTTDSGQLPTDADLKRSIREGMPYTGMPAWPNLSERQITNLMYFIKTFNDDFAGPYGTPETVEIPDPPSYSEESVQRGREAYVENQCYDCHGDQGRGDGTSAPTLEDQWGNHIRPADMTKRWTFRGGQTRRDIYRTFTTGLDGTPMPSYNIAEEDRWALVDYVYSLSRDEPNYATVVVAQSVEGEIDVSQGPAAFSGADSAYFPVIGQVIEPGRSFSPGVNGVEVKAVYNEDEIAFMLTWHTMTADTTGENGPAMEVPAAEDRDHPVRMEPAGDTLSVPFSDAVAVQVPSEMPEGNVKPYFMFGDDENAVDIWFADLAEDAPEFFVGQGSDNIEPGEEDLDFYSSYADGAWTAIFKRQRTPEEGLAFEAESFVPVAFSIWDGFNRERGNKRGITSWYYVYLEPTETPSAVLPMLQYGLLTLLLEVGLIVFVRRKYKKKVPA